MKLLKNEKQWLRWLEGDVGLYREEIESRTGHATQPPKFPCYGYAVVQSYSYEEQRPLYLSAAELNSMHKKLVAAYEAMLSAAPDAPQPAVQPADHFADASKMVQPAERNFCERCGKRLFSGHIHTCTPPSDQFVDANKMMQPAEQLSDEQIAAIVREAARGAATRRDGTTSTRIARAIEAAHGIKPKEA